MVRLGVVERAGRTNLCAQGAVVCLGQRLLEAGGHLGRRGRLLRRGGVDGRAVLRPDVVALAHALRRVVSFEEGGQQRLITHDRRIEDHQHHFGVPSAATADLVVGGVRREAPGVANCSCVHARQRPELALGTPETAHAEDGLLEPIREGWRDLGSEHEMRRPDRHRLVPTRERPLRIHHLPLMRGEQPHSASIRLP